MDEFLSRWSAYFHMTETQFVWAVVVITVLIASLFRFFRNLVDEGKGSEEHDKDQGRPKLPGGGPLSPGVPLIERGIEVPPAPPHPLRRSQRGDHSG